MRSEFSWSMCSMRSLRRRSGIVPAQGPYGWKVIGLKDKQPYAVTVGEASTFALAGLWDAWHDKKTDQWLQSFTIVTTQLNEQRFICGGAGN